MADGFDMPVIRATASAEDLEPREKGAQPAVMSRQFLRIADIKIGAFVEFRMAAAGSVCT